MNYEEEQVLDYVEKSENIWMIWYQYGLGVLKLKKIYYS